MPEKYRNFIAEATKLQDTIGNYTHMFEDFESLFQNDPIIHAVVGNIEMDRVDSRPGSIKVTVDVSRLAPDSTITVNALVGANKDNLVKLYGVVLPHPRVVTIREIKNLKTDEVLGKILGEIRMSDKVRHSFKPKYIEE